MALSVAAGTRLVLQHMLRFSCSCLCKQALKSDCLLLFVLACVQLDRLGHARGGDVTGHVRDNLYDSKLLQQKLGHLQVRQIHACKHGVCRV
jgi:hypothetical protein